MALTTKYVRFTHEDDGTCRYLTDEQRWRWDRSCGFVGHILEAERPMTFEALVAACHGYADAFHEPRLEPAEIERQLAELVNHDLAKVVLEVSHG
jgi:hypothetical protein